MRLNDQCRSLNVFARLEVIARHHCDVLPPVIEPHAGSMQGRDRAGGKHVRCLRRDARRHDRLDADRRHHYLRGVGAKTELTSMQVLEGRVHRVERSEGYGQRCVAPGSAYIDRALDVEIDRRETLRSERVARCCLKRDKLLLEPRQRFWLQRAFDGATTDFTNVREPDTVGGHEARQRVYQHTIDAQGLSHPAGMLARRAAEAEQREARAVVALANRDVLDGVCHGFDRDAQESCRDRFGRACSHTFLLNLARQLVEGAAYFGDIE